jgi:hypothetical protein
MDDIREQKASSLYLTNDPPCVYGKHLTYMGEQQSLKHWTCKAYPSGIPKFILTRFFSHESVTGMEEEESVAYESKELEFAPGVFMTVNFAGEWQEVKK